MAKKKGPPAKYDSPEELEILIEDYFNLEGKKTISGLAYHLGFASRQSLYDYEDKEDFAYIVRRGRLRVEVYYEERLQETACTGAIFALKNMGWKDKTEQEIHGAMPVVWQEQVLYNEALS